MQSLVVVKGHVASKLGCDVVIMVETNTMHNVALHRVEERLDMHIVVHLARPVHALQDAAACQASAEQRAGVFHAMVAVKDQPARWLPRLQRLIECAHHEPYTTGLA